MRYGAMYMFLLAALRGAPLRFEWAWPYALSLAFLALLGSVIAFGTYLTLLGRIGPDRAAFVTVLLPVVALTLSTLFEGLRWNPLQVIGVPIVLLGNGLALRGHRMG